MAIPSNEITSTKIPIIFCAHLALISLHVTNNLNIDEVSNQFLNHLLDIDGDFKNNGIRKIIIDGIQHIFEISDLNNGEEILIANIITTYLKLSTHCQLKEILIKMMKKLRGLYSQNLVNNDCGFTKITQALFQHILPILKQISQIQDNEQVSELIVLVLLLAMDDAPLANKNSCNFFTLFNYFITSHNVSLSIVGPSMALLLKEEGVLRQLEACYVNYHVIITQVRILI